jgi:signal transduction histidine kinase
MDDNKEIHGEFDPSANPFDSEKYERMAQKALEERPTLSIRARLMIGFLLFFFLTSGLIISTIIILNHLDTKIQFLVIADRYTAEIQQARRFEKNYFLYGTNLSDIFEHILSAQSLVNSSKSELEKVLGKNNMTTMTEHINEYLDLLRQLEVKDLGRDLNNLPQYPEIEAKLRKHGSLMVSFAFDLSEKERKSMRLMLKWNKRVPLVFLFFLLILAIYEANFLSRQIMGRLSRLVEMTKRIAEGDFTPIMPDRKYRDEFSNVTLSLNSMMHDITRHQEVMIQSHKLRAVGTLTAGIAHELNNPLNNITITAAMLEEDYPNLSDEERLDMVRDLVKEAERSERIVRNLLDFARESEITTEHLDISQLLEETVKFASNEIKLHKVQTELDISDNLPFIHGDRQQLSQVFLNLILNALDAMGEGGMLKISVHRYKTPEFIEIKVKDNGAGIQPHILSRVFDPFFTTKPTGKGTGLGLSVSLGIIKQHGGDMHVESILGKGTEFGVILPIAEMPAAIKNN